MEKSPIKRKARSRAVADLASLERIFTVPESEESTLAIINKAISEDLRRFLLDNIVALEKPLADIEQVFSKFTIDEHPSYVSDYSDLIMRELVAHSVHTASPRFIGHMTSALPYFMLPLANIVTALNQNLVKVETSKAFTPMERQVLAMLHGLVFGQSDGFYRQHMHSAQGALGVVCSGGTVANLTALWTARNNFLGTQDLARRGLVTALLDQGLTGLSIIVSERGHYSIGKCADVLGIGRDHVVAITTNSEHRVDVAEVERAVAAERAEGRGVLAIVGVAGATETGTVDDLEALADIASKEGCHFHVDAAWGGATLFSSQYRHLLKGIERADSVTIDAHKQFYVPMGAGMVLFRDPCAAHAIKHHAQYIIREGSKDIGSQTLEGSRSGIALLVHAALHIMGRRGYELLINRGVERARWFARVIEQSDDFELLVPPELNILGYRYVPLAVKQKLSEARQAEQAAVNNALDEFTEQLQKLQRETGVSFVSRTRVPIGKYDRRSTTMLRVVLANPLTTEEDLLAILDEQRALAGRLEFRL